MANIYDKFLRYPSRTDSDEVHQLTKDFYEISLAKQVGAVDWVSDFQEFMNDQAGAGTFEIKGRDFSNAGEGATDFWVDTQELVRDKSASSISMYLEWDAGGPKSGSFAGIAGGLTNGLVFFWDRTFNFSGFPVVVRLFQTAPPITDNSDLFQFANMPLEVLNLTSPNKTIIKSTFRFRNPPRLQNRPGAGFVSDRLGVTLNDNFNVTDAELVSFIIRVNGDSLWLNRSLV